ncbi:Protein of unknown function [Clostridium sp. DSM 8431]|uniref:DUF2628 domain-containing protein n=1 Tax=Clostridium sp. DSM 8431 TaxID=1761781 RepID=UPI0008F19B4F|nr:DUF2628 domain-containing protein [Clostridium sp. DSM 8431]SFU63480.1 Protein of unknown function [Clostridium sp. DSM 8431]
MYCRHCGHELDENNKCINPECPSNLNKNNYDSNEEPNINRNSNDYFNNNFFNNNNEITPSELVAFFGEKKADYYLEKWDAYQENHNFISWNWCSFLCGFYWFWYRKMYSIVAIILTVEILGSSLLNRGVTSILSLGITIGCGLFGNQLYMKHTDKKIKSIKSLSSRNLDYESMMRKLRVNGGTSIIPVIIAVIMAILLTLMTVFVFLFGVSLANSGTIPIY